MHLSEANHARAVRVRTCRMPIQQKPSGQSEQLLGRSPRRDLRACRELCLVPTGESCTWQALEEAQQAAAAAASVCWSRPLCPLLRVAFVDAIASRISRLQAVGHYCPAIPLPFPLSPETLPPNARTINRN